MKPFRLKILAADHVFFDGETESLVIPTLDGKYGVMANHANAVIAVTPGTVERAEGEERHVAFVSNGIAKIENGEVLLLVEAAERPDEIDEARARRAWEEANDEIRVHKSKYDVRAAEVKIARALNRLKAKDTQDKM